MIVHVLMFISSSHHTINFTTSPIILMDGSEEDKDVFVFNDDDVT